MTSLLSICIPTYNRAKDLEKNLELLQQQIIESGTQNRVNVLVSDNASTDDTGIVLSSFKEKATIVFDYVIQKENTGAEKNQILAGEMSRSEYILLLGDDDYLNPSYIKKVVDIVESNPNISCIIPNYYGISPSGEFIMSRDPLAQQRLYKKGFEACLKNSWKAHQLSGLVFRRHHLYEEYHARGVHNLYPQIFLIAYSTLNGDCLYLPQYPTLVTSIPQTKKDWKYSADGLMCDIFDNFLHLGLSNKEVAMLEKDFIKRNPSRVTISTSPIHIIKAILAIITSRNTIARAKFFCLWFFPLYLIKCSIELLLKPDK